MEDILESAMKIESYIRELKHRTNSPLEGLGNDELISNLFFDAISTESEKIISVLIDIE